MALINPQGLESRNPVLSRRMRRKHPHQPATRERIQDEHVRGRRIRIHRHTLDAALQLAYAQSWLLVFELMTPPRPSKFRDYLKAPHHVNSFFVLQSQLYLSIIITSSL